MSKSQRQSEMGIHQNQPPVRSARRRNQCSYERAGVSISKGEAFVKVISKIAVQTSREGADVDLGQFGAVSDPKKWGFHDPLLITAADGVGTKLLLTQQGNKWEAIGKDLVAMSVNDLVAQGATPLFFLDYLACSNIKKQPLSKIVTGIGLACHEAGCALIGGETAEMPRLYREEGHFDLAGFAVGAVERDALLPKQNAREGDVVLGLVSNGIHANGFSLVHDILEDKKIEKNEKLICDLLEPTRIYVKPMLDAISKTENVRGIAHITGGGLVKNLPRALMQKDLAIEIDATSWELPEIFQFLMREGHIPAEEMVNIFNCGIGMAVIIAENDAQTLTDSLQQSGETVYQIGRITNRDGKKINITGLDRWS